VIGRPVGEVATFAADPTNAPRWYRNCGEPGGFGAVAAPVMARAIRAANRKDLAALKALL
jgi:hypothetical protein